MRIVYVVLIFCILNACKSNSDGELVDKQEAFVKINADEYYDKVYASWLGQIIGNIYGLPHENQYIEEGRPDSLSTFGYSGWPLERMKTVNGAFSDDDTDIEYMYLLQMQKHGIEPTYEQLTLAWTYHIRDRVWLANRAALTAMSLGFRPPLTGNRKYNPHWFQIDPQLVNEIWAVTAPGMTNYACAKSAWAARITNDNWGIEPTIHYAAMYSAAFFEKDVERLIAIGVKALPEGSRFIETVEEVKRIHAKFPDPGDWRKARKEISDKFYQNEPIATRTMWNANLNAACGILALLYGKGDFKTTLDISCALCWDADNQAATMAGLLGIINGSKGLPRELLFPLDSLSWEKPFNDLYKNVSRHDLPDSRISGMARVTVEQAERIIVSKGGRIEQEEGEKFYWIPTDATFEPPLEIATIPNLNFEFGRSVNHHISTSLTAKKIQWEANGSSMPAGLSFKNGVISGTPTQDGEYQLSLTAKHGTQKTTQKIAFRVYGKNLAPLAKEIIAGVKKTDSERRDKMWITVGRNLFADEVSIINDGKWVGDKSVFYSIDDSTEPHEDFYGYLWEEAQTMGHIAFRTGPMEENGGWFKSLNVEFLNKDGDWESTDNLIIAPEMDTTNQVLKKGHFVEYQLSFSPVKSKGIRIKGEAGGGEHWMPESQNAYFTSITELKIFPPHNEKPGIDTADN
ncbi:MAG: ADP-ribosylglycohydrolase family protein [Bacteroidota bacterium]